MGDETSLGALLPLLDVRAAWTLGTVVVLAILRPTGRLGWAVAAAWVAAALASTAAVTFDLAPGVWMLVPWLGLLVLLSLGAAGRPARWEPRTGPSAATALLVGAAFVHAGMAWHLGGERLAPAIDAWAGDLVPSALPGEAAGPLFLPLGWLLRSVPGISARTAALTGGLVAAALLVAGASALGRRWGSIGTARATAAAVAWAPPLLLSHAYAPAALMAGAALVWAWWALGEVWAGRYLPDRAALASGALLGVAAGLALWPLVLAPLWLRRLGGRRAAWFVVGIGAAALATLLSLVPTAIGLGDLWRAGVVDAVRAGPLPWPFAALVVGVAVTMLLVGRPLSPTRLSAVTAVLLLALTPWWPQAWPTVGPVAAVAFVLLATVAPDGPTQRWPADPDPQTETETESAPAGAA